MVVFGLAKIMYLCDFQLILTYIYLMQKKTVDLILLSFEEFH